MRRKIFSRLVTLFLSVLMLLSVLAGPVSAIPVAVGENEFFFEGGDTEAASKAKGYAALSFGNVQTTGSDLRGNFEYTTGVAGALNQTSGYVVALQPNTWYYLKYTESAAVSGSAAALYMFYRDGNLWRAYSLNERSELLFYTGSETGRCELLLPGAEATIGIAKYALSQVASFDLLYDVRTTSFAEDHAELFPQIDLKKYEKAGGEFVELITMYDDLEFHEDGSNSGATYLYFFNPTGWRVKSGELSYTVNGKTYTATLSVFSSSDIRLVKARVDGWGFRCKTDSAGKENYNIRRYDISTVKLTYENRGSKIFHYSGYFLIADKLENGKVIGASVTGDFETKVNLDIHYTYYRTDTSPKGANYHNQVDSIYFNVPDYLKEAYGKLVDVKLSYQRARTKPGIAVGDSDLYDELLKYVFVDASEGIEGAPQLSSGGVSSVADYEFSYNFPGIKGEKGIDTINLLFKVENIFAGFRSPESTVSREEIAKWMYNYTVSNVNTVQGANGPISRRYFSEVDDVSVINVASLNLSADSYAKNHDFFSKWAEYGLSYALNGGTLTDVSLDLSQKIVEITNEPQLVGAGAPDRLYYAEADKSKLLECFRKSELTDSTMYLVRFNVSDYYMCPLKGVYKNMIASHAGYAFAQDVYLNLHVLELTYENDLGVETVIPVSSNHIDAIADATQEKTPEEINRQARAELGGKLGGFFDGILDKFKQTGKILGLILGVIVLVLIVVFVVPVVSPIFRLVFGAIGRFFRWIRDKLRGASAKRRQRKSKRK